MFETYLKRWNLTPDGNPIATHSSDLLPVLRNGTPTILKVARSEEERRGADLMQWWDGEGAARVLAQDGDAILLERATGTQSLADMARTGHDDDASRILCDVASMLHVQRDRQLPEVVPLADWFEELWPAAAKRGGTFAAAATTARELLATPHDICVLHGDLHHGNVLDFGSRGWLAIDPKGLVGERGFDFANIFRNPDLKTALAPNCLSRRATIIAQRARLDRRRLLRWVLAYAGLSAAWTLAERGDIALDITTATLAAAELAKG